MKIQKNKKLFESQLNLNDLKNRNKKGGLNGDVLIQKIKNFEPLVVKKDGEEKDIIVINGEDDEASGEEGVVNSISIDNKGEQYDSEAGEDFFKTGNKYDPSIEGNDDEYYKLNDLKKTSDFGSSSGSSLGTQATRDVESIQSLMLAYKQSVRRVISIKDFDILLSTSNRNFELFLSDIYSESKSSINKDLLRQYINDWGTTFIKTANALWDKPTKISIGKKSDLILRQDIKYNFYQISSQQGVCLAIKDAFKRCVKSVNISKWNPADIWIVSKESESVIINKLQNCNSVKELNSIINQKFDNRELIGVSLKKVTKGETIKMIINKVTSLPRYKFKNVRTSEDPFSTIGVTICAERSSFAFGDADEFMTIRSSNADAIRNICGEISGKSARQGKVSLTKINKILERFGIDQIPSTSEMKEFDEEYLKEEIIRLTEKLSIYDLIPSTSRLVKDSNLGRLISKYQSLCLGEILIDHKDLLLSKHSSLSISDEILEEMFHYALSIRYDNLRTPKYIRVID